MKKKWSEKMVKAWKQRIEQYRYAIRKGKYGVLFGDPCGICAATYEHDSHGCTRCPFWASSIAHSLQHKEALAPCFSKNRYHLWEKRNKPFDRECLEARLQEIIEIGRETGVIK